MSDFEVAVGAGTLRGSAADAVSFPHRWTPAGVTVEAAFTGAHLLHLAAAGCVLNDVYREAERLGLFVRGVRVTASGGFDAGTWRSTGIVYAVEVDAPCSQQELNDLLASVDAVAEIPKAIRAGTTVERAFPQGADLSSGLLPGERPGNEGQPDGGAVSRHGRRGPGPGCRSRFCAGGGPVGDVSGTSTDS